MINQFDGEYSFLSNFYSAPVMYEGLLYKNSEAAFQSAKLANKEDRERFCDYPPNVAKSEGRRVRLRHDWEHIKEQVMEDIVRDKFIRNEYLRKSLIETGNKTLIEGNWWGDRVWGTYHGEGQNKLGKILMKIREELRGE